MQWAGHTFRLLCKFKNMDTSSCASCVKHNSIKDREICGQCLTVQFVFPAFSNSLCCSHDWFGIQVPFYICNINNYACQNPKSEEPLWYLHGFHLSDVLFLPFIKCFISCPSHRTGGSHITPISNGKDMFYFPNLLKGSKNMMVIW